MIAALLMAAAVTQASAVSRAPAAPAPPVIINPDWVSKPNGDDYAKFYPSAAATTRAEGQATISCQVTAEGTLADCKVIAESPAGLGFGDAALKISALFKMNPSTVNGRPVAGGTVRIPIRFVMSNDPVIPSMQLVAQCYGIEAAHAELDPTSKLAQMANFALGLVLEARWVSQNTRPSEVATKLAALRQEGADRLNDPASKSIRDTCDELTSKMPPGEMDQLLSRLPP